MCDRRCGGENEWRRPAKNGVLGWVEKAAVVERGRMEGVVDKRSASRVV